MSTKRLSRRALATALTQPQILAFLPALTLGAYWTGGEAALLATALFVPVVYALAGLPRDTRAEPVQTTDGVTGLPFRQAVIDALEDVLSHNNARGMTTASLASRSRGWAMWRTGSAPRRSIWSCAEWPNACRGPCAARTRSRGLMARGS